MTNYRNHIAELLDDAGEDTEDAEEDRGKPGVWERILRERSPLNEEEHAKGRSMWPGFGGPTSCWGRNAGGP